jgi:antitoxin HicB
MPNVYGVKITKDEHDFAVSVRDLPEVCTFGNTYEDALILAEDAVHAVVCYRIEQGADLPVPSPVLDGEVAMALPLHIEAKVELYRAWRASRISKSELARRMQVHETEVRRILTPSHATRIETLDRAFKALGYKASLSIYHPAAERGALSQTC